MESKWTDNKIFEDENHFCRIDFSASLWATTDLTGLYGNAKLTNLLSSVDSVVETAKSKSNKPQMPTVVESEDMLLLMEYKKFGDDRSDCEALTNKQKQDLRLTQVAKKYYDSLHYAIAMRQNVGSRKIYVWILESPNGDAFLRNQIREKLRKKLPFLLQKQNNFHEPLIDELHVISIREWSQMFKQFPISIKQSGKFVSVEA